MNPGKESSGHPSVEELIKENQSQREQLKKAQAEIERLRKALEEALRSLKRQAAPFSKGKPKTNPKRPGRKGGKDYGQRAFRAVPDRVDEEIAVVLPKRCPDCGGRVIYDSTYPQFQEDIVRRTIVRCFDVEIGHCESCRGPVHGAPPLANFRRFGSGPGASGAAGVDAGRAFDQTAGDLSRAHGSGFGMGLWFGSEPKRALPSDNAIGDKGAADVSRTSDRRASQSGQSAR